MSSATLASNRNMEFNQRRKFNKKNNKIDNKVNKLLSKWGQIHITSIKDTRRLSNEIGSLLEHFIKTEC